MLRYACLLVMAVSAVGFGCSVKRIPPPEELVATADSIYVGKTTKGSQPHSVKIEVIDVLKGSRKKGDTFEMQGQVDEYDGPNDEKPPYKFVRPGGRHGNCFAGDYKNGGLFLFLSRKDSVHFAALAPTNEEVSGVDDPWVKWVKQRVNNK